MKSLIKQQYESYGNTKTCFTCKGKFENKYLKDNKYHKVRDYCHYTGEYRGAVDSITSENMRSQKLQGYRK